MLLFLLVSCQEKVVSDSASVDTSVSIEPSGESQPENVVEESSATILEEGKWAYSNITIVEDECGFPIEIQYYLQQSLLDLDYDLNYIADNNYVLSFALNEDSQASTTCINNMEQFICDDLTFLVPTHESTVTEVYSSKGMITSSTRIEGTVIKNHTCDGPDCEQIAEDNSMIFPCSVTMEYTFNFFD